MINNLVAFELYDNVTMSKNNDVDNPTKKKFHQKLSEFVQP